MAKCRKVTKEERIEIVKYCMEHNLDYSGTCKVFDVTYSTYLTGSESTEKKVKTDYQTDVDAVKRMRS